jgi:hypothetical protein
VLLAVVDLVVVVDVILEEVELVETGVVLYPALHMADNSQLAAKSR